MNRNDELKNCITKKFQALIVKALAQRLVTHAGVRERFRQQKRIAEFVTDAFFERCHITVISERSRRILQFARGKQDSGVTGKANGRRDRLRSSRRYRF